MVPKILSDMKSFGPTVREIFNMFWHNPLSKYFVWFAHDKDEHLYINTDETKGFIVECTPIPYTTDKVLQLSEALTRLPIPPMSVVQILMHADDYIEEFLESYQNLRSHHPSDSLVHEAVQRTCDYLRKCTKGIPQMANIPLRNFRVIVSAKWPDHPDVDQSEVRILVEERLRGMGLSPRHMKPGKLLEWLRRLFNDEVPETLYKGEKLAATYDENQPIGAQVLYAENEVQVRPFHRHIQIGGRYWRCMTPKTYPKPPKLIDPLQTKEVTVGGIWGNQSNDEQYNTPFLYCLNIIYDDLKTEINLKTDVVMWQQAAGAAHIRAMNRRRAEQIWASDKVNGGEAFSHIMPIMWFYAPTDEEAKRAVKRGKQIWERHGYTMQEDRWILPALLLSSLPMGMRATPNNLRVMQRTTIADPAAICNLMPIQGEFVGLRDSIDKNGNYAVSSHCKTFYSGRSGQIIPFSVFNPIASSFNGLTCAETGGGKSYDENIINFNENTTGIAIRISDMGGSYKKQCLVNKGRYIDLAYEKPKMNPFSNISKDTAVDNEGFSKQQNDLASTGSIMMQMAYSSSNEPNISEYEWTLMKDAVDWSWKEAGNDASPDEVYAYLREFPNHQSGHIITTNAIREAATHLAFNIREFTSYGRYPDLFVGKSDFDIKSDPFVVFDMESLENNKDLFNTMALVVLTAYSRDLYESDRSQPRFIKFDEAKRVLKGRGNNRMFVDIMDKGFRTARKFNGSFWVIIQSPLDKKVLGEVGEVIWGNSVYKHYLKSPDFADAARQGILDVDEFTLAQLKSLDNIEDRYSEKFVQTPFGSGVVRIAQDSFNHFLYTSKASHNAEMEKMVREGMSWKDAINAMVCKYHRA